jgi:hypothetical protein
MFFLARGDRTEGKKKPIRQPLQNSPFRRRKKIGRAALLGLDRKAALPFKSYKFRRLQDKVSPRFSVRHRPAAPKTNARQKGKTPAS